MDCRDGDGRISSEVGHADGYGQNPYYWHVGAILVSIVFAIAFCWRFSRKPFTRRSPDYF